MVMLTNGIRLSTMNMVLIKMSIFIGTISFLLLMDPTCTISSIYSLYSIIVFLKNLKINYIIVEFEFAWL